MRLDATDLRYVTPDEWRVLTAVETGSRNHEVVPTPLIAQLSKLTGGQVNKCLGVLARRSLIARVMGNKYDGYRLTYFGLDHLSLHTFVHRTPFPSVTGVGTRIGVGKEGDIYIVKGGGGKGKVIVDDDDSEAGSDAESVITTARTIKGKGKGREIIETREDRQLILKIHRLGRISFRAIKSKRDYLGSLKSASWMYMSCLAAQKEFEFMKVLWGAGFDVPEPVDRVRHCLVMGLVDGYPMRQLSILPANQIPLLYGKLLTLIVRLAYAGLIHGDFNEFNVMIVEKSEEEPIPAGPEDGEEEGEVFSKPKVEDMGLNGEVEPVLIDFPQMVSTRHENAEYLFNRDVNCIRRFFRKRFRFESEDYPNFREVMMDIAAAEKRKLAGGEAKTPREGAAASNDAGVGEDEEEEEEFELMRLDEVVEASGFGRGLQKQLEQYMSEVADAPGEGSGEEEIGSDDSEEESESESEESEEGEEEDGSEEESESDDDEDELADQVGELNVNSESEDNPPTNLSPAPPSSVGGHTTHSRATTSGKSRGSAAAQPARLQNIVAQDISKDRVKQEQKHHARKGTSGAGKAKGHKYKNSKAVKVGNTSADGW